MVKISRVGGRIGSKVSPEVGVDLAKNAPKNHIHSGKKVDILLKSMVIAGFLVVGTEVAVLKSEIKKSEQEAITAGNLNEQEIKQMEKFIGRDSNRQHIGIANEYNEFANKLRAKKTVAEIIKERLGQEKEADIQKQIQQINEFYKKAEADIFEKAK